jgi:hypothetical protein
MPGPATNAPLRPGRAVLGKTSPSQVPRWISMCRNHNPRPSLPHSRRTTTTSPDTSIRCTHTPRCRDESKNCHYRVAHVLVEIPAVSPRAVRTGLTGRSRRDAVLCSTVQSVRTAHRQIIRIAGKRAAFNLVPSTDAASQKGRVRLSPAAVIQPPHFSQAQASSRVAFKKTNSSATPLW